jgi:hypothetical protein
MSDRSRKLWTRLKLSKYRSIDYGNELIDSMLRIELSIERRAICLDDDFSFDSVP